jgi:hypothetical protein
MAMLRKYYLNLEEKKYTHMYQRKKEEKKQ